MIFVTFFNLFTVIYFQSKYVVGQSTITLINVPFWQEVESWSKCSTSCGEGIQEKQYECFKRTYYLIEHISAEKCQSVNKPTSITRKCNYGDCNQLFVWKSTEWGKCSHTCGYAGIQTNEVECFVRAEGDKFTATDPEKCNLEGRPSHVRVCNRFNCPVLFQAGRWGNCITLDQCSAGKQQRNLTCISLLNTGKIMNLPKAACYQKGAVPPAAWRKCYEHIDDDKCFQIKKKLEPEITEQKRILVQMRRVNKLQLQVGHISYVIPGTKVIVICPVKNYLEMNLIWLFNKSKYGYNGKKRGRIRVNKKGKLTIKSFLIQDQGEWICQAGNTTASVVLKLKSPSDGFKDWAIRNTLWNKVIPNEDFQMDMMNQEIIRWVTGSWSRCSITCDGVGTQYRFVRCEKLENRFYYQLDDAECLKKFETKPQSTRDCRQHFRCPEWKLMSADKKKCTEKCLNFGKGAISGSLECIYQNQTVDHQKCDKNNKPFLECDNPECTVKWKISSWTKCSRSCGDSGIQARYLMCVWNTNGELAGSLCYKAGLPVPRVIKACKAPKCNLECVDLFKNCKRKKHYCQIGMYNFRCCKTCRGYFRSLRNKQSKKKY